MLANMRLPQKIGLAITLVGTLSLTGPSALFAQNYGSQFYSSVDFPGDAWPNNPVPATSVSIGNPTGLATDAAGNVYIAGPSIVYKLDTSGMLTRVAGNGHNGFSGDGVAATQALLGFPRATAYDPIDWNDVIGSITVDGAGNIYLADMFNNRIRKISPDGVISTVAGSGNDTPTLFKGDGGPATEADLWLPDGIAVDADGRLLIADGGNIQQVNTDGTIQSLIGNDCGHHELPGVCAPQGVAVDISGNLYVADGYCRVRKIAFGATALVAGNENPDPRGLVYTCGFSGDGGPAARAAMTNGAALAVDAAGNLYIADTYNNRIRKVSPEGIITTVAGSGPSYRGSYFGDGGRAIDARLNLPRGLAVDRDGNLYIADSENFRVRKVTPDGIITTVAGNGVWSGPLTVTSLTLDRSNARLGEAFNAAVYGFNLPAGTYFDVQFRAPGSSDDSVALNWQTAASATHTITAGTATGSWTITGVRAHPNAGDHSGSFVPVNVTISVLPEP
jgi:sugar lactone lactonase YvrE